MANDDEEHPETWTTAEWDRFNDPLIAEFRASRGKCRGWETIDLLLLTTIGARSGRPHSTLLGYMIDAGRIIVFAARAGSAKQPSWYHNLVANPLVTIELGGETWQTRAVVAAGEERDRLFNRRVAEAPFIADYQVTAGRQIPVVVLGPKKA
jgi:deazaflavin-dependent oxidoreductase (nitroreductase family)